MRSAISPDAPVECQQNVRSFLLKDARISYSTA